MKHHSGDRNTLETAMLSQEGSQLLAAGELGVCRGGMKPRGSDAREAISDIPK